MENLCNPTFVTALEEASSLRSAYFQAFQSTQVDRWEIRFRMKKEPFLSYILDWMEKLDAKIKTARENLDFNSLAWENWRRDNLLRCVSIRKVYEERLNIEDSKVKVYV